MPDTRTHRGSAPGDAQLFGPAQITLLRSAVEDYSLLLTRGYAEKSALKLVGDRFELTHRQRLAVMRSSCSDEQLQSRNARRLKLKSIRKSSLAIDGYNLLITIEAAISGAFIFVGRDGCVRDIAGIHGTYRKVEETTPALKLIIEFVNSLNPSEVVWLLDKPVSNSGKLKTLIEELSDNADFSVSLSNNPDAELITTSAIVASADGVVLDNCARWVNLAVQIIADKIPSARIIDLSQT
ncbi:MAG: DUF434 domain-containing protein [Phycisphaerae bacterium]